MGGLVSTRRNVNTDRKGSSGPGLLSPGLTWFGYFRDGDGDEGSRLYLSVEEPCKRNRLQKRSLVRVKRNRNPKDSGVTPFCFT